MGSVGPFPVTGRKMRPVTDEIPTELFEITARDEGHCNISRPRACGAAGDKNQNKGIEDILDVEITYLEIPPLI